MPPRARSSALQHCRPVALLRAASLFRGTYGSAGALRSGPCAGTTRPLRQDRSVMTSPSDYISRHVACASTNFSPCLFERIRLAPSLPCLPLQAAWGVVEEFCNTLNNPPVVPPPRRRATTELGAIANPSTLASTASLLVPSPTTRSYSISGDSAAQVLALLQSQWASAQCLNMVSSCASLAWCL